MKLIGRERKCSPFPYSTDTWYPSAVDTLDRHLMQQNTPKERAAGFVLGGGRLLYLLAHADVKTMYMDDLHQEVVDATFRSIDIFQRSDNWLDYKTGVLEGLNRRDRGYFNLEWSNVCSSKLITKQNFDLTQERTRNTNVAGFVGDIRETGPTIAAQMNAQGEEVIVANCTNAAQFFSDGRWFQTRYSRMELLGKAIAAMPLSDEIVIADSTMSGYCMTDIYTRNSYPGLGKAA